MTTIFLVAQFVLAIILTIAVMLQKSSSIGLGAYSGSNESLFGAKGPAGFLAKFTFVIGFLFIANTLALGYFYNQSTKETLANEIVKEEKQIVPDAPKKVSKEAPQAPSAPNIKEKGKTDAK